MFPSGWMAALIQLWPASSKPFVDEWANGMSATLMAALADFIGKQRVWSAFVLLSLKAWIRKPQPSPAP